jgi:hypothetical protein
MSEQQIRGMPDDDVLIFHIGERWAIKAKRIPIPEQEEVIAPASVPLRLPSGEIPPYQDWRQNSGLRFSSPPVFANAQELAAPSSSNRLSKMRKQKASLHEHSRGMS